MFVGECPAMSSHPNQDVFLLHAQYTFTFHSQSMEIHHKSLDIGQIKG